MGRWRFAHGHNVVGRAARKTWRRNLPAWLGLTKAHGRPSGLVLRVGDVSWWFAVYRVEAKRRITTADVAHWERKGGAS
jgi:hypothetical protein